MRKDYREDLTLWEAKERVDNILLFIGQILSTNDYNRLPISIKQAIEFIFDYVKGDDK